MKIYGSRNRAQDPGVIYGNRDFSYKLEPNWAKWPENLKGCIAVCGCFDKEDNLYVSTRGTDSPIVVFDDDGNYLKSLGQGLFSNNLHGLFVTPRNTLLCTDGDRHVVREINMEGKLLRDFGKLDHPSDTGYEPDVFSWLKREYKIPTDMPFDATFAFLDRFNTIKHVGEPFNKPTRMIETISGDFFATDGYGNAAVHKFTANGELIKTWGGSGKNDGEFRLPHGLWFDKKERIWVADRENFRVQVFTTEGELIAIVDDLIYKPAEVWSNEDNIFIAEVDGGITILDMEMKIVSQFGYANSPLISHGLCGDTKGNLYVQTLWFNKNSNLLKLTRI